MVAGVNHAVGGLVSGWAAVFVVVLGLFQVDVAVGVLAPGTRRLALWVGVGPAVATGLLGQDLGGLLTGHATDPGSGPPPVLFALTLWPRAATRAERTTARAHANP